jgi:hypothetical protein
MPIIGRVFCESALIVERFDLEIFFPVLWTKSVQLERFFPVEKR